jgi:DNA mismatch repair protein MutS2
MLHFSNAVNKVPGLRFIADALELQSGLGRQHLMKQPFMLVPAEISRQLGMVEAFRELLQTGKSKLIADLKHALSEVHDITGTLNSLKPGFVLDDVGLFEIKRFALITSRISQAMQQLGFNAVEFKDTDEVILLLDPDKQRVPHFYIYNSYSERLARLRKRYADLVSNIKSQTDHDEADDARIQCIEEEDRVREELSSDLLKHKIDLLENLALVADIDLWLAKAGLAVVFKMCKPKIDLDNNSTRYIQLFNPSIAEALKQRGKQYQPVDIEFGNDPVLLTGANMGGKTVLLKTLTLAQYLFQFGFFIPADQAVVVPVERVMTSMEDEQSELQGLSSFAAEMLKINSIIEAAKAGKSMLALIDEPARTTNPTEGQAIVNSLIDILEANSVRSLVTTHYSGITSTCRRLKVAGLRTEEFTSAPTIETINDHMDYSLIELKPVTDGGLSYEDDVPHEALHIASILNVDIELLERAACYITKERISSKH